MNISTERRIMDLENRLVGLLDARGRDRELGVIRYNLEQIYKQILLSSIENYV